MADYQHDFLRPPPPPPFRQGQPNQYDMGREKTSFSVVKYIFFGFNVFLWLLGCGVLSLAIWLWSTRGTTTSVIPTHSYLSTSSLCIIASVLVLVIGFLGCFGAFLENQCLLIGYFTLVLLVFALEITAGTLGFVMKDKVRDVIREELTGGIRYDYRTHVQLEYESKNMSVYDKDRRGWSVTLDTLQQELKCCGANNHTDWFHVSAWPSQKHVPESCCIQQVEYCGMGNKELWFSRGCLEELDYWFTRNMYILGVTGITVGSVQILAMVAAIAQFCYIRSKRFPL